MVVVKYFRWEEVIRSKNELKVSYKNIFNKNIIRHCNNIWRNDKFYIFHKKNKNSYVKVRVENVNDLQFM